MDSVAYKPLGVANNHLVSGNGQMGRFEWRHLKLLFILIALFITIIISLQIVSQQRPVVVNFGKDYSDSISTRHSKESGPPETSDQRHNYHIYHHRHIDGHQHEPQDDDLLYDDATRQEPVWWITDIRYKYIVLGNYIRATKSFNFNSTVTLTTQGTLEFMYHTIELCSRWDGPLSVAIYAPGEELTSSITMIKYLRSCHPVSECIRQKVTWHLVYDITHGPKISEVNYPGYYVSHNPKVINNLETYCEHHRKFQYQLKNLGHDKRGDDSDISDITKMVELLSNNYRKTNQLPYPINVLRNTARLLAKTKYLLASDIELYPSINMVPSFMNLIERSIMLPSSLPQITNHKKHVFTLPIFEVFNDVEAPKTKPELLNLILKGKAIFFHKYVCDQCQEFPRRLDWVDDIKDNDDYLDTKITIFDVTKRNNSHPYWEPIYIGKNDEPLYDDRLTWEGRRDKMGQMYEMCLQGYYLLVLDNAFLVHAPGVKHIDNKDNVKRSKYIKENNMIYNSKMYELKKLYQSNKEELLTC